MNKKILIGILFTVTFVFARAEIYCPKGPADCVKSSTGQTTCTVVGNDGMWRFFTVMPSLPADGTHHSFVFIEAHARVTKVPVPADSSCGYADLNDSQVYVTVFRSKIRLLPDLNLGSLWNTPGSNGITTCTAPVSGFCLFKQPKLQ